MRLRKPVWRNNPEQVKVKLNGKEIAPVEEGTVNYEITYENNYEVGKEAYIVIKVGKNSEYAGSVKKKFTIKGEAFSTKTVFIDSFVEQTDYNGSELHQDTMVLYDKAKYDAAGTEAEKQAAKLVEGTDYEELYDQKSNPDSGYGRKQDSYRRTQQSRRKTGCSDFLQRNDTGKRITAKMIKDAKVEVINKQSFKLQGVVPEKTDLKVTFGKDKTPVTNEEFEIISCTKNDKKGAAVMVIQGKGQYGGTKTVKFAIGARGMDTFKEK